MRRLLTFLAQPYPVLESPTVQLRRAALIGLFIGGFLLLFQPFGLHVWHPAHKALKIGGFGVITFAVTAAHYLAWPALLPGAFRENRWTVGRAALFLNLNLLLIALGNALYVSALTHTPLRAGTLTWMLLATFLIGAFPVTATVTATYIRQLRHYQAGAATLGQAAVKADTSSRPVVEAAGSRPPLPAVITLTPDNGRDVLALPAAHLYYLEAADNYCTVVYGPPGAAPARTLLRASLSRLAGQVAEQGTEKIARVHRSYLANLGRVMRVSGNAQGYRLHFGHTLPDTIPVARAYNDAVTVALGRSA